MDDLLVDAFCGGIVNATLSELVGVRDAIDGVCGKWNIWNAAAPSRALTPARSERQPNTSTTSTCCGKVSMSNVMSAVSFCFSVAVSRAPLMSEHMMSSPRGSNTLEEGVQLALVSSQ